MVAGVVLLSAGGMLMYLAVVDIDLKDVVEGFLNGTVIVRRPKAGTEIAGKDSSPAPKGK